jgi:hypothetical protein
MSEWNLKDFCKKLPKPVQVTVFRTALVVAGPVIIPLSCVSPAAKFVWELLGEYKDLLTRPEL